jgi:translocation and assembly module TamB
LSALPQLPLEHEPPREPVPFPKRARWKRVLGWIAAGIGILILLLVIGVIVVLKSPTVHRYVLRVAQQKATAALGTNVQVRDFALHWSGISPSLDLYNVVVAGAAPYTNPPLLDVDHIHLGVTVSSLLHRNWYINDVTLDHPVVRVFVDKSGTGNLPQTKSNPQQKNKTSVFDLGVRHAVLDRGEIYYNNRKSVLDADLHDLNFQSGFDVAQNKYAGTLGYKQGRIKFETFNPMVHDLQAQFAATPTAFTLERATLTSGPSQFVLSATLDDYAHPKVTAQYEAVVDAGQVRHIMKNASLPTGVIRANGKLDYVSKPNTPMIATLTLNGDLSSRALNVQMPTFHGAITDIGAHYAVANNNLEVRNMHAGILGGELTAQMTMRDITGASRSNMTAELRGLSLAQVKQQMNSPALQKVALGGSMNATADANWGKTFNDLIAKTDATIQASIAPAAGGNATPLNGAIHARYAAASKQVSLDQSYFRLPQTSLTLNGTVSDRSALRVQMQSNDLHELETLADNFRTAQPGQTVQPLGLYGTASFNGAVSGTTAAPRVTGQFNAANLRVHGSAWRMLRTNVDASPSGASLTNGELEPADRGRITFNLRAGLDGWAFTQASPFQVGMNASNVNVADLTKAAGSQTPITGTLTANVNASGTEASPVGRGNISLTGAKIAGQPVQLANVNFNGTGNQVNATLAVKLPAGTANGNVTYDPKQQSYVAQLQANGIHLDQLQAVKDKNMQLAGVLNLNASGRGTLKNPGLEATAQIPELKIKNQTISGITLQTTVANHVANYTLDSRVINTGIHSRGTVNLTGEYLANATLDTQPIAFAPLVAMYAPSQAGNINGQTELHATLRGPLKNKALVEAHITIPQLTANYKNTVQLAAAAPIHLDYANGTLQLQRAALRGTGTDLQFQGTVPVVNKNAPVSLLLLGTVDLRLAQMLNPDVISSGQLRFDINSYGQRSDPNVEGQVRIVNANFATGSAPLGLQNGNGVLTLTKDRLNITQFRGTVGGGTLTASGGVVYRPSLQFDLGMAGDNIRLLYPDTVRENISTNLALSGNTNAALLRGTVRINQLSFTPDFDLMSFAGQFGGVATPPPAQGFSQNLKLDIGVQSETGLNLVSRTLSFEGAANLHVTGTAAEPVILGRVNINGGDLIFNGNRFVLQGGTVDFVNPSRTEPVLNAAVTTDIQQYNIQMRFWGPIDHLHTNYASDPALPPADIINLVAFGKTTEASAANPTPPGNLGAESLIASQVSSRVTSRLEKLAGISQLSIDPELGGDQQNPGARVAIKQRVTSKIFVTFATDVTATQRQEIKLEYQKSPRLSFSAVRDQNGGFGFDTKIHKRW